MINLIGLREPLDQAETLLALHQKKLKIIVNFPEPAVIAPSRPCLLSSNGAQHETKEAKDTKEQLTRPKLT